MNQQKLHSIVVPVYNSRAMLQVLSQRIAAAMEGKRNAYELILIDDGSRDDSFEEIKRLASGNPAIRGFQLSRNFGHQAAVYLGLQKARGEYVAIMDDDLQDPPEILPVFFKSLYDGFDVGYGVRKGRKEGFIRRFFYAVFYRFLNSISTYEIPIDSGDFCAMRRRVVDAMLQLYSARPYLRGIRFWVGFKQVGIPYERAARLSGKPGYTFRKYFAFAATAILSFSYVPLRIAVYLGLLTTIACLIFTTFVVVSYMAGTLRVPGYASLIVVVTFLGAVQLISVGIIGEYIGRLLDETRRWPLALIADVTLGESA